MTSKEEKHIQEVDASGWGRRPGGWSLRAWAIWGGEAGAKRYQISVEGWKMGERYELGPGGKRRSITRLKQVGQYEDRIKLYKNRKSIRI